MQKIFRQLRADIGSSAHLRIEVTFSAKLFEDRYDGAPRNTVTAGNIPRGREPTATPEASGADLRTIQLLMGHERLEDTTIYLHLSQRHLHTAVNPLDQLTLRTPEERQKG